MSVLIGMTSFILFFVSLIWFIVRAIRGKPKKQPAIGLLVCLVIFFVSVSVYSNSETNKTQEDTTDESAQDPLSVLIWQVETGIASKYDGYTIEHDGTVITVNVWKDSITNTIDLIQSSGSDTNNENWIFLVNNTQNTVDFINSCIQTSDSEITSLIFNVISDESGASTFMTFTDTILTYEYINVNNDLRTKDDAAEDKSYPEIMQDDIPQEEINSEKDVFEVNSRSSGNASNFDTYNNISQQNTSATYVLNTSTYKFHYPDCRSVPKISPDNYGTSDGPRESLISQGYDPCGICEP